MDPSELAPSSDRYVAFAGDRRLDAGDLARAATAARRAHADDAHAVLLVFDRDTGRVVDLDLRGTEADVAARYALPPAPAPRRGRPRLGVVAREVTLLPRHWDWLARQPGGASVALRRLVEAARKADGPWDAERARIEAGYRFMSAMAGDLPGFEEASRALFAGDRGRLADLIAPWPVDIAREILGFLGPS
ncbi:MAG: DUF2239 family protein [Alphaproteobacteria bacterium]|nr:DUF2239 family protein [Alphaproteobacteria bacterium]